MQSNKKPHSIDVTVGRKIRKRRKMLRISQAEIGNRLGISFQQVQKYENGTNRVSASRLQSIADILDVPASWFFEDVGEGEAKVPSISGDDETDAFLATTEGLDFCRAISRISSKDQRLALLKLVQTCAEREASVQKEQRATRLLRI